MGIYFVGLRARPEAHLEAAKEVGGAYVNCWIKANSEQEARSVAFDFITSEGWTVETVEQEPRLVTKPDRETEERFEQAKIDGSCYEFHQWPVDDRSDEHLR